MSVETMHNGTLRLAPHGFGYVECSKDIVLTEGNGIEFEQANASSVLLDSPVLENLMGTLDTLTQTVAALVQKTDCEVSGLHVGLSTGVSVRDAKSFSCATQLSLTAGDVRRR